MPYARRDYKFHKKYRSIHNQIEALLSLHHNGIILLMLFNYMWITCSYIWQRLDVLWLLACTLHNYWCQDRYSIGPQSFSSLRQHEVHEWSASVSAQLSTCILIVDHHLPFVDQSRDQTFNSIYGHTRYVNMARANVKKTEKECRPSALKGQNSVDYRSKRSCEWTDVQMKRAIQAAMKGANPMKSLKSWHCGRVKHATKPKWVPYVAQKEVKKLVRFPFKCCRHGVLKKTTLKALHSVGDATKMNGKLKVLWNGSHYLMHTLKGRSLNAQ